VKYGPRQLALRHSSHFQTGTAFMPLQVSHACQMLTVRGPQLFEFFCHEYTFLW
jgi:hypothetical protein